MVLIGCMQRVQDETALVSQPEPFNQSESVTLNWSEQTRLRVAGPNGALNYYDLRASLTIGSLLNLCANGAK